MSLFTTRHTRTSSGRWFSAGVAGVAAAAVAGALVLAPGTGSGTAEPAATPVANSTKVSGAVMKRPVLEKGEKGKAVRWVQRQLDRKPTGNFGKGTKRAVKRYQRTNAVAVTGAVTWATWRKLLGRVGSLGKRVERLRWKALARCESSNNPRAVSSNGQFHGLYQFSKPTWSGVGGDGRPSRRSARQQTFRAKLLYLDRGSAPWPHCGSRLY